jgi:hypothetical protein
MKLLHMLLHVSVGRSVLQEAAARAQPLPVIWWFIIIPHNQGLP